MALTKPVLNSVVAWDVADGQTFTFSVVGGDAVIGNTLYILDNSTNTVVYTLTTTGFQYRAVVPANASGLSNGIYYSAYITTTNSNGDISDASNSIQFYCYTTPSWAISNISSGAVINNSSIAPQADYSQTEGEALGDYSFVLYDSSQVQLSSSGIIYTGSSASTLSVTYDFLGLENNTVYYIRATGHTVEGTVLDTGLIRFTVTYLQPSNYSLLTLQNNCEDGYITYSSLAVDIEGTSNPDPPTYTENGVDLTAEGSYVNWTDFEVSGDYTAKVWVQNFTLGQALTFLSNQDGGTVQVVLEEDTEDSTKIVAWLYVNGGYAIYSNSITAPASTDEVCIQVRKINDLYDIVIGVTA